MRLGALVDSSYDPGRPSWLPYWLPTPTEMGMDLGLYGGADTKTVYPAPPMPLPPPVPAGGYAGAAVDPNAVDQVVSASAEANRNRIQQFFTSVDSTVNSDTQPINALWIYIALGLVVYFAMPKGGAGWADGGRRR